MKKSFVLVTGASGFVGKALCGKLHETNYYVRAVVRKASKEITGVDEFVEIDDIASDIDWQKILCGVDTIIHLVSRAHVTRDKSPDPLSEFRRINVTGTEKLVRAAAKYGVRRFIYLSSIKVNGENTSKNKCFTEESVPHPQDHYGISKWEAEQVLHKIQKETGLEIVILRPPLVYGPGVKANFLSLIKLVNFRIPLPFASIQNNRSIIYAGNLIDAILKCIDHPDAKNQTFLVSDEKELSTPELIIKISETFGYRPLVFRFPVSLLIALGKISGKSQEIEKITNSLCVDTSKIIKTLSWVQPFTTEQGLKLTINRIKSL